MSVTFGGKSSFTVRPLKNSDRVWIKASDRNDPMIIVPTFKSGYVSMSFWVRFQRLGPHR